MTNPLRKLLNALTGKKATRTEARPWFGNCSHLQMEIEDLWFDHGPIVIYTCGLNNREVGRSAYTVPGTYLPGPYYSPSAICPIADECSIMNQ